MKNAMMVISPYWKAGTWVFDDAAVNLQAEPFVMGIPAIIDKMLADNKLNIKKAQKGFRLLFSHLPFPEYHVKLDWVRADCGGNWYRWNKEKMDGWLCPALFKYFPQAPECIYAKAELIKD